MAKPIVDGIDQELQGPGEALIRLNVSQDPGRSLAGKYGVRGVPTLIVLDGQGKPSLTQVGRLHKDDVLQAVDQIN